jgi:hypothetical protein
LVRDSTSLFRELLKIDELKMTRHFMVERFFPKIVLARFASQLLRFQLEIGGLTNLRLAGPDNH